ncbi:MAG TPA: trypsin-like peptidase domain-containing protein [Pirellulaceae bacterium]|nr:trypsin-like peptidase domain-containing protein [Pirellulaceae bacterium]
MTMRPLPRFIAAITLLLAPATIPALAQEPSGLQAASALESVLVDAIAKSERSVVAVARIRDSDGALDNEPRAKDATQPDVVPDDFGSGVVIDAKGLILTNYHVLGDLKNSTYYVWVQRKPYRAKVRAADPWLDLAVLSIEASDLTPLGFGNANDLKKGQIVIALGNPYAIARDGQPSASYGIVANLLRPAPRPKEAAERGEGRETLHHYGNLIQTDCKLELGSSGGALINLKGEMIGLTTSLAALSGYERTGGFAIPVDDSFRRAVESLKAGKLPEYGFLGVEPQILEAQERRQGRHGARIRHVAAATPAAKAGIQEGDVITHVNARAVSDEIDLMRHLGGLPPGETVAITLQRGASETRPGRTLKIKVQLSKKQIASLRPGFAEVVDPAWRGMKVEYATASPAFRDQSPLLDAEGCVAVVEVARDSPAWKAGMRPGEFISHVGTTRVTTPRQFYQLVETQTGPVAIRLTAVGLDKAERTIGQSETPLEVPTQPDAES